MKTTPLQLLDVWWTCWFLASLITGIRSLGPFYFDWQFVRASGRNGIAKTMTRLAVLDAVVRIALSLPASVAGILGLLDVGFAGRLSQLVTLALFGLLPPLYALLGLIRFRDRETAIAQVRRERLQGARQAQNSGDEQQEEG